MNSAGPSSRQKSSFANVQVSTNWILLIGLILIGLEKHSVKPDSHTVGALSTIIARDISHLVSVVDNGANSVGATGTHQIEIEWCARQECNNTVGRVEHHVDGGVEAGRYDIRSA